jgi:hypothetical protein
MLPEKRIAAGQMMSSVIGLGTKVVTFGTSAAKVRAGGIA